MKKIRNVLERSRSNIVDMRPTGFANVLKVFWGNISDLLLKQASEISLKNSETKKLSCGYVMFWECPKKIPSKNGQLEAEEDFETSYENFRAKYWMRLRQVLRRSYKFLWGKKIDLQLKSFGNVSDYFWSKKGKIRSSRFFVNPILCICDQFWKCFRLLSEQKCWNAAETYPGKVWVKLQSIFVELQLRKIVGLSQKIY